MATKYSDQPDGSPCTAQRTVSVVGGADVRRVSGTHIHALNIHHPFRRRGKVRCRCGQRNALQQMRHSPLHLEVAEVTLDSKFQFAAL